jgi:hypothetical protein
MASPGDELEEELASPPQAASEALLHQLVKHLKNGGKTDLQLLDEQDAWKGLSPS